MILGGLVAAIRIVFVFDCLVVIINAIFVVCTHVVWKHVESVISCGSEQRFFYSSNFIHCQYID